MKITFRVQGIDQYNAAAAALDPVRAKRILEHYLRAAGTRVGQAGQAAIRHAIRHGNYTKNSPLTEIIKGSTKPLVHKGDLWQAVAFELTREGGVRIGVFRMAGEHNLAVLLHEGFSYVPTARQRAKVWALVAEALGKSRAGASGAATRRAARSIATGGRKAGGLWVVPARPFIAEPLGQPGFASEVRLTYEKAIAQAIAQIGRGRG